MRQQATRCTQRQLAYLSHWQALGYHFDRDAVIPQDTRIAPDAWRVPRRVELAATAITLVGAYLAMWMAA